MLDRNLVFFLLTIASSFLFGVYLNPPAPFTKKDILRSLFEISHSVDNDAASKRVLIGFNANLDAVVPNAQDFMLRFLGQGVVDSVPEVTSGGIEILERADFAHVFAHHFKTSSAGERSILSDKLWREIVAFLEADANPEIQLKLGGNAALMSEALVKGDGAKPNVTMFGLAGPRVIGRLPNSAHTITGQPQVQILGERFDTLVDEIHLILEYPAGAKFGRFVAAQRANRFIVSRDFANGVVGGAELLKDHQDIAADLIILAGIHLMDSLLPKLESKVERIKQINAALRGSSSTVPRIHFEFASTSDGAFTKAMAEQVEYESLSMNEEEFYSICSSLELCTETKDASLLAKTQVPNVKRVQQVTQALFARLPKLARLHYHSYAYHFIAQRANSETSARWPNARQAVAAGSLRSTLRACAVSQVEELHGRQLTMQIASIKTAGDEVREISKEEPVLRFEGEGVEFYLAPVVACAVPRQTVGLGDNISAAALAKQL